MEFKRRMRWSPPKQVEKKKAPNQSYHHTEMGSYDARLPRDLDGYIHLTYEAWMAAPMNGGPLTKEQAKKLAQKARLETRAAQSKIATGSTWALPPPVADADTCAE